jgi:hypothetical protein
MIYEKNIKIELDMHLTFIHIYDEFRNASITQKARSKIKEGSARGNGDGNVEECIDYRNDE